MDRGTYLCNYHDLHLVVNGFNIVEHKYKGYANIELKLCAEKLGKITSGYRIIKNINCVADVDDIKTDEKGEIEVTLKGGSKFKAMIKNESVWWEK